jgi:hypothetical protein
LQTVLLVALEVAIGCGGPLPDLELSREEAPAVACPSYRPGKQVFFGDLHVHTGFSSDAYAWRARLTPDDAYAFARGARLTLAGTQTHQLGRPLDFAAVTDHSEMLSPAAAPAGSGARREAWRRELDAAANNLDAIGCTFTTFIGYEWTGPRWQHRNVIFRNAHVPSVPISASDVHTAEDLWAGLKSRCLDAGSGCDALAIPHNTNFTEGLTFRIEPEITAEQAAFRARMEPLVEIYQIKGNSECKRGVDSDDPLCSFEQVGRPVCDGTNAGHCIPICSGADARNCEAPLSYVRNALKKGLAVEERIGVNPLRLGILASTDTHSGTPGATEEHSFKGGHLIADLDPRDRLAVDRQFGSGGLAAVWAEENSREAIFLALRRRETYGTSGTRPKVRFFGGFELPPGMCKRRDFVEVGYARGVPMGGELKPHPRSGSPRFVVWAMRDPGDPGHPGTPLQHIQIVKGWLDPSTGATHEKVYEVAGHAHNGASVDPETCTQSGPGSDELCGSWRDPEFIRSQRAFYYARVLENPSCRHTAYDCMAIPPASRPATCRDPNRLTLQERAWTSPIWYSPSR